MLHGRRKGKKLRGFQAGLVSGLLPRLAVDLAGGAFDPRALFRPPAREICLEIGFGGGEHLAYAARRHPENGFLGCEPFVNGAAKLLSSIEALSLGNIRLHNGDASELIALLPDASLDRIYLLYPDPWPKRRQRKRRFVSDAMLTELGRVLRPGGEFRFATDIDDYAGWTLARVLRSQAFQWRPSNSCDWVKPWPDWPGTRYEAKAAQAGRPSSYLTFMRRDDLPLRPPLPDRAQDSHFL